MCLYNVQVSPYFPNPVRCSRCQKFGHGKGQCKGKLTCFKCGEEDHEGFDCTNDIMCCNCGQPQMVFSKDCHSRWSIHVAMHNSSPSLSPPTMECQLGRYLNSEDLRRKVSGITRMVYSNRRLSIRTQASYQGWFPNETTVGNINYLIEPLATAFFKDHFS
jgi:hypothetical protein